MDIAQNSIKAEARNVVVEIKNIGDKIVMLIEDDGCGMDKEIVKRVTDPFYTTRTTRKVGLGIPFLKQHAEQTGGVVTMFSEKGIGTKLTATFVTSNIDCPPVGDIHVTIALLITGNPGVNFVFSYLKDAKEYGLTTIDIKEAIGDFDISMPKVTGFIKEMIKENLLNIGVELY
jgi:hypothetical protein